MSGSVVGQILNCDRCRLGKHSCIVKLEAGFLKESSCLINVVRACQSRIEVTDSFLTVEVPGDRILIISIVDCEDAALAVRHSCRNEGTCRLLSGLSDSVNNVLTVDQDGECMSHRCSLLRGLAVKQRAVDVECNIVGSKVRNDEEVIILFHVRDLIVRNGIDELKGTIIVSIVDRGIVRAQHEVDGIQGYVIRIPVIRVLLIGHGLVVLPCGAGHRTGGDKSALQCPCAGVLAVRVCLGDSLLRYREECRECAQIKEVCARLGQMCGEGGAILGSLDGQSAVIVEAKVRGLTQIAVISSSVRIRKTVPGVYNVRCIQRLAVRPLQSFLHLEGIGQTVIRDLRLTVRKLRNQFAALIIGIQAGEGQDRQARAVNRAVQRRVQMIRFGSQVRVQDLVRCSHVRKILESKQIVIQAVAVCIQHVDIIVEIDRNNSPCIHQLIFRLMHQRLTLCKIGLLIDLIDLRIIVFPVRGSLAALSGLLNFGLVRHCAHAEGRQYHRAGKQH